MATWVDLLSYLNTLNKQHRLCDILVSINNVVGQLVDDDIKWSLLLYWLAQIQLDRESKVKSLVNIHKTFFSSNPLGELVCQYINRQTVYFSVNAPVSIICKIYSSLLKGRCFEEQTFMMTLIVKV